jgi:hypothetical protein
LAAAWRWRQAAKVIFANNGHPESFRFHQGQLMHIVLNTCMTGDTMMACAGFSLHQ